LGKCLKFRLLSQLLLGKGGLFSCKSMSGACPSVVVNNYDTWDVRKATTNKLVKNGTWKRGPVCATILSRDWVSTLTKEHAAILGEIGSKAPALAPVEEEEEEEEEEEFEEEEEEEEVVLEQGNLGDAESLADEDIEALFDSSGDGEEEEEPEQHPKKGKEPMAKNRTSYLTNPVGTNATKYNKRRVAKKKHANSIKRVLNGKNYGSNQLAQLLNPRAKKKRKKKQDAYVPPLVQEWYDELDGNGKSGSVGLVPQPWLKAYTTGGRVWNVQKAIATPEGQTVIHFVRWLNKKKKRRRKEEDAHSE